MKSLGFRSSLVFLGWALMGPVALGMGACPGALDSEDPCHWISDDIDHPLCPSWLKDLDALSDSAAVDAAAVDATAGGVTDAGLASGLLDSGHDTDDSTAADAGKEDVTTIGSASDTEPPDDGDTGTADDGDVNAAIEGDVGADAVEESDAGTGDSPQG